MVSTSTAKLKTHGDALDALEVALPADREPRKMLTYTPRLRLKLRPRHRGSTAAGSAANFPDWEYIIIKEKRLKEYRQLS